MPTQSPEIPWSSHADSARIFDLQNSQDTSGYSDVRTRITRIIIIQHNHINLWVCGSLHRDRYDQRKRSAPMNHALWRIIAHAGTSCRRSVTTVSIWRFGWVIIIKNLSQKSEERQVYLSREDVERIAGRRPDWFQSVIWARAITRALVVESF